jgi:hypothetical protein
MAYWATLLTQVIAVPNGRVFGNVPEFPGRGRFAPGGSVWVTAEQLKRRLGRRSQFLYDREVVGGEA